VLKDIKYIFNYLSQQSWINIFKYLLKIKANRKLVYIIFSWKN